MSCEPDPHSASHQPLVLLDFNMFDNGVNVKEESLWFNLHFLKYSPGLHLCLCSFAI